MKRRLALLSLAALAAPVGAIAQAGRQKGVGVLRVVGDGFTESLRAEKESFLEALAAHGFRDGANVGVRWFEFGADENWDEAVPKLASRMSAAGLDCLVAIGDMLTRFLAASTRTIPIVAEMNDPVSLGLVKQLARPGGNITGVHRGLEEVSIKRVQFFRQIVPSTRAVAWIASRGSLSFLPTFEAAATRGGLAVRRVILDSLDEQAVALMNAEFPRLHPEACLCAHIVTSSPELQQLAAELSLRHRIALSHSGTAERDGILFGYTAADKFGLARLAPIAARILRGEKAAEMAIEGPTKYRLAINQRTAARIGVAFPGDIVMLADRVVR